MAWHASAIKRLRRDARVHLDNKSKMASLRTVIKKARIEGDASCTKDAQSALAKAAAKGLVHKNAAARKTSRLMKRLNNTPS